MHVNLKYLAKSVRSIADEDKDSRIQLVQQERESLKAAAEILDRLAKLKAAFIQSATKDGDAQDRLAHELVTLLGIECRS